MHICIAMMKQSAFSLLLFLTTTLSSAQEATGQGDGTPQTRLTYLTANIITPINPQSARWRMGLITSVHDRWMIGLDVAYANENIVPVTPRGFEHYRLYDVRPEVYYIMSSTTRTKQYGSVSLCYLNQSGLIMNGYYPTDGLQETKIAFDQAEYRRIKHAIHFKVGLIDQFWRRLGFNAYFGGGLLTQIKTLGQIVNPRVETHKPPDCCLFDTIFAKKEEVRVVQGRITFLDFTAGVKLSYRLM